MAKTMSFKSDFSCVSVTVSLQKTSPPNRQQGHYLSVLGILLLLFEVDSMENTVNLFDIASAAIFVPF